MVYDFGGLVRCEKGQAGPVRVESEVPVVCDNVDWCCTGDGGG